MVRGRTAIAAMWKGMAEQVASPKLTTLEVKRLSPSTAREIGTFSLTTKGSSPKEISGKYLVLWQRVQGDWKLAADIWNDGK
jgi:ketosteroid isomerase-like protein